MDAFKNQHYLDIDHNQEVIYRVRSNFLNNKNQLIFELYNKKNKCWESVLNKDINDSYTFNKKHSLSSIDLYSNG